MADTWAGVVRVSYVGGRGGDTFHADEDQVRDLEDEIARMGPDHSLHLLPPEMDVSGGLPLEERPALIAGVEGVERGEYAGIMVSYLSRLGRNLPEQLRAWKRVEDAGGRIIVVREKIDTTTWAGELQRNILLSVAHAERQQHVERFDERRRLATEAGVWSQRQTPIGYTRDPATRRLTPGDNAAEVQRAFRDRANGRPISAIAKRLRMTPSGTRQMLRNRVYLGELRSGQYVNVTAHPPLLTADEWEAAQITVPRPPRSALAPALLGGLVICQACGHVMTRRTTAQVVYQCPKSHSGQDCPWPAAIGANRLEAHVERIALDHLRRLEPTASMITGDLDAAREAVAKAERELGAYVEAVSVEDVGVEAFAAGARTRRRAVDDARDMLRRAQAVAPAAPAYGGALDVWEGLNGHERNTVLRALLEAVVVRKAVGRRTQPVGERVRVVAFGAGMLPERSGARDAGYGIVPVEWPDVDGPGVLRVLGGEDAF